MSFKHGEHATRQLAPGLDAYFVRHPGSCWWCINSVDNWWICNTPFLILRSKRWFAEVQGWVGLIFSSPDAAADYLKAKFRLT